jgi:hypothetical protein
VFKCIDKRSRVGFWIKRVRKPLDEASSPLAVEGWDAGGGQTRGVWLFIALLFCAIFRPQLAIAAAPAYYTLSDFQLYIHGADGSKRRTELLSALSRRQILVGIVAANAAERDRKREQLQVFLQQPAGGQPVWQHYQLGPSGDDFATYVIRTTEEQSLAGMAILLNTMQESTRVDYALPVVKLGQSPVAPFIEFRAEFSAAAQPDRIANFIRRQPVTVLAQHDTAYRLRLQTQAVTNILAVIRAFEEAGHLVNMVQPIWLNIDTSPPVSVSTPASRPTDQATLPGDTTPTPPGITAQVTLDTGWHFPLVEIREPVLYHLQIDYRQPIRIVPESIAISALRRHLLQATGLPPELIDITEVKRETASQPEGRQRERVTYSIRLSKPGTYWLPGLPITYSLDQSRHTTHTIESLPAAGHFLTLTAHLPPRTEALPGDLLSVPRLAQDQSWLPPLALGGIGSGLVLLAAGLLLRPLRQPRTAATKTRSPRQTRHLYQLEWQRLHDAIPSDTPLSAPAVRDWLRDCAAVLRQLLGEQLCGNAAIFTGGAGVSADLILSRLPQPTTEQTELIAPSLHLLQELDSRAAAPVADLSLAAQQQLCKAFQHIILSLTAQEAARVLRPSHRL